MGEGVGGGHGGTGRASGTPHHGPGCPVSTMQVLVTLHICLKLRLNHYTNKEKTISLQPLKRIIDASNTNRRIKWQIIPQKVTSD
jgi:hypothetical protein